MRLSRLAQLLLAVAVVAGCGESLLAEDTSPGLRGKDGDSNGIRDDIDQLIDLKYANTPELKQAAQLKARALQSFMEATTQEEATRAADALGRSTTCVMQQLPGEENRSRRRFLSAELEAWTANTRERFLKYWQSSTLVSGAYFTLPPQPICY